ncbi:cbb3-type cytochrome oxidase assembly protein CcoS [Frateuria terrea]|uniref:Cytochrome oxidase maturation protein, cbb3-type n=1 Tax=Frateuria terrea TaxID=529704 RepID=A0A1H6VLH8_9GAMM|nr:cbb3-type cytochrome oxidase assembly protein CcoS [Frateuria terrea]SEJ04526.1 cytochrome oxidase maturation protein, cbb3-type [Frateuria terrea]SFP63264.1 cytochrome oxidase maturation protein, cbb3-type [Frateuria terrea]
MNILLVLIPVTGMIVLVAVALFFWAANHQQFDDLDSPAVLPLLEDEAVPAPDADEALATQEPSVGDDPNSPHRPHEEPDRAK